MSFESAMKYLESGTFEPGTMDKIWWEYYDRIILATGTTRHQFFAVPLGQGGKTESDTNWQLANQMPESEKMMVMYLCFYYVSEVSPIAAATYQFIMDLMKHGWFQLRVYNKAPWVQFPLAIAFGNHMPLVVTGAAAGDSLTSRSIINGVYELPIEIPLAAKTTVNVELNFTTASNVALDGDEIYFSMAGIRQTFGN